MFKQQSQICHEEDVDGVFVLLYRIQEQSITQRLTGL
jgi:hypothetical protein